MDEFVRRAGVQRIDAKERFEEWNGAGRTAKPGAARELGPVIPSLLIVVVEREQLTVGYLVDLMTREATVVDLWDGASVPDEPVTYIGLERPEGLHPESRVVTLENLRDLVPG